MINIEQYGMKNEVDLCVSCQSDFPACKADSIIWGTGKGKDNVAACSTYKPISLRSNTEMRIEQIAFASNDPQALIENLKLLGLTEWFHDEVTAVGMIKGINSPRENRAELHFNYQMGFELEILKYISGPNWHRYRNKEGRDAFLSHIGMHVSAKVMEDIKMKMLGNGIKIAQEVYTSSHTNPHIAGKRKYHYVVFDTIDIFGFDLKLIERIML